MRDVWTEENKFSAYLEVETLAAEAWSRLGVVPEEDVEKIRANASFKVERIKEIEQQTRHDVVAFTRAVSESLGEEKKWVHYGLTSTDVVDTANGYLLKQADAILLKDLEEFQAVLKKRALEFKSTPCIGRTHGVHADITSFGLKWALWYEEMKRNIDRFKYAAAGVEAGTSRIIEGLNEVLTSDTDCFIALETMAGKGSEIGRSFEELARIYDGVKYSDKLRVCFDTCHTSDSGYDIIHHFDDVIEKFDRIIGKDQIAVFHINDSKNVPGAAKDRHENIGFGEIGFDALNYIVHHPDFEKIPKILETPYIPSPTVPKKSYAPYKYEIEMLRNGVFDPDMKETIIKENKAAL